ncbi:oligopeptide ABC transporter ATP-binding protein OppD [Spiroplasma endosymbiont of Crioceris asparagi]|uniref:oligopeptide ABC transporter ATP-binding protein OppD n=1 Tax=Spiroplasma endosymbiont of Crioceris asparagi TaxID=3066286 RepID=UPI0030CFE48B
MKKILSVENLVVKFRVRSKILTAIRNINFDVYEGETVAIVGESGSGKSVFTKTFTNMLESNGWIANGSIIYYPPETENAKISYTTDLTDFHHNLLDRDFKKWIIKKTKSFIKELEDFKKQINNLDETATNQEIKDLQAKIDLLKPNLGFGKKSDRASVKIQRYEFKIKELTNILNLAKDVEAKAKEIQAIDEEIEDYKSQLSFFISAPRRERVFLAEVIEGIKKMFKESVPFDSELKVKLEEYFNNKTNLTQVERIIKGIYKNVIVNGETFDEDQYRLFVYKAKFFKMSDFMKRQAVKKDISNLRGATIATIFQDPMTSLNPLLSVGFQISEVLRKHSKMSKSEARKETIEILKKVGIPNAEKRYHDIPGKYSGGMRQRVVIAIALACKPKILLCDEPTTALDVTIQAQILNLIKDLQKEYNFTTIFITHDLGVVANIADRVAVMYSGQIVEYGKVDEIFYDPQHPYTWALLSSLPQLGKKGEDLYSIAGTPPSLFKKIKGDAFAPRNPYALKIDYLYEPPMFKVTDTHYAKTWLLHEKSPKVEKPKQLEKLKK